MHLHNVQLQRLPATNNWQVAINTKFVSDYETFIRLYQFDSMDTYTYIYIYLLPANFHMNNDILEMANFSNFLFVMGPTMSGWICTTSVAIVNNFKIGKWMRDRIFKYNFPINISSLFIRDLFGEVSQLSIWRKSFSTD